MPLKRGMSVNKLPGHMEARQETELKQLRYDSVQMPSLPLPITLGSPYSDSLFDSGPCS